MTSSSPTPRPAARCRTSSAGTSWRGAAKIAGDVATVRGDRGEPRHHPAPDRHRGIRRAVQVGIPGDLVDYIAQFERAGVNNAELAFWNAYGALGDMLTGTGGSPNAAYWLYRWYGQMTGNMVTVVPPGPTAVGLDGAASVNSAGNQVSVIFGGGSGSTAVTVNGLGSRRFGTTAHVVLEQTVSAGRTTAVVGPAISSPRQLHHQQRLHHRTDQFDERRQRLPPGWSRRQRRRAVRHLQIKNVNSGLAGHQRQRHRAGHPGRPGHRGQQQPPSTGPWSPRGPTTTRSRTTPSGLLLGIRTRASRTARRADLGRQRHLRPPVAGHLAGQRRVQDRELQQRPAAREC